MKKTWNIISETLNRKVKNPIPETMTINGQDCIDKGTIAESFNTLFASIGKQNELNIRTPANNETKLCLRCMPVICRHCRQRISVKNMPQNC